MYESLTGTNRSAPSAENCFKGAVMYEDWKAEEVQVPLAAHETLLTPST